MSAVVDQLATIIAEHSHDYDADDFINGTVPGRGVHNCYCDARFATRDEWAAHVAGVLRGLPLHQRLLGSADDIAELNASQGLSAERAAVSPKYLRELAAANMEQGAEL